MRHGWFVIPGRQTGDRTIAEQRSGVEKALAQCVGKSVLDLGCAEGLLSKEFAIAGAKLVLGMDSLAAHLAVALDVCRDCHNVYFEKADLNVPPPLTRAYDIVLALGVAHKLHKPEIGIRYAASASRDLVLVRMTRGSRDGLMCSKHIPTNCCNVTTEMSLAGFTLECVEPGPRKETVHYYRKKPK